ncbi:C4-dicarboxylate ABC transporter [Nitrosomonas sp.]|uniref:C4-dicarboxylate ABC transporter n=1 Tax=Nitrosomonas sp. TaxID=42353 RepID=UPI0026023720|nr:C4-dicarboxylate ABC transporter [Nitrosomonas sp.]
MKTFQVLFMSAVIVSGAVFGVLSMFELPLPTTPMEWVVSDVILGAILYLVYMVIAGFSSSKTKVRHSLKKVTA